jgi:MFS family permease
MTLDFLATFFGSATLLLPMFAQESLSVGARGYGFLAAAPAIGSVLTALVMARIGSFHRQGRLVVWSVAVFGVATAAFGVSKVYWFSLLMLGVVGAADTVSTVLRQTIRQLVTPNYLRGRMTSINMMFFMGGPQLGELEAGSLAAVVGAPMSVVIGGLGSFVCAAIAAVKSKSLMNFEIKE